MEVSSMSGSRLSVVTGWVGVAVVLSLLLPADPALARGKRRRAARPEAVWLSADDLVVHDDGSTELRLAPGQRAVLSPGPPADLLDVETLVLPVRSLAPAGSPPSQLELRILSATGAMHWRPVEVAWTTPGRVEIPLGLTRAGTEGPVSDWSHVSGIELFARNGALLAVGAPRLVGGDRPGAAWTSVDQVALAAFGPRPVRRTPGPVLGVVTDVADADVEALQALADEVSGVLDRLLPGVPPPCGPAIFILTADRDGWFDAMDRVTMAMGGNLQPANGGGLTLQGIAAVGWDPELAEARPVIAHELAHALLDRRCWMPDDIGWLDEAVAVRVQLHLHPQEGLTEEMRGWKRAPLARVLDGGRVPRGSYWQAVTVLEMLRRHERYAGHWPALLEAIRSRGSADLRPLVQPVLGVDMEELEADWERWVEEQPAPGPLPPP
ncbi:MAG: hypothetical protein D6798_17230 [Deltaproteobacteria bacterium]|nr:MAG: hypothetical protein D6798_17230 [Deltaproteobacteria bacterium]